LTYTGKEISAIGIAYKMHGLVAIDKSKTLRDPPLTGEVAGQSKHENGFLIRFAKKNVCYIC